MIKVLIGVVIGAGIAWTFPQPEWAKKFYDWVKGLFSKAVEATKDSMDETKADDAPAAPTNPDVTVSAAGTVHDKATGKFVKKS